MMNPHDAPTGDLVRVERISKTYPGVEASLRGTKLEWKGPALWARNLVRAHRLWESYLETHFDLPRDHLHDAAERMEHFLDPQLQAELDAELAGRAVDPHGKAIPPREATGEREA